MSHVSRDLTGLLGKLNEEEAELEASFVPGKGITVMKGVQSWPPGFFTYSKLPEKLLPYKATRESVQATISRWLSESKARMLSSDSLALLISAKRWQDAACAALLMVMNRGRQSAWVSKFSYACARMYDMTYSINFGKGQGYGSNTDVLDNFRQASKAFPWLPTPQDAVKLWMFKHADFLRKLNATGVVHGDEGVESRCADIILYAALGDALDKEDASNVQEQAR